MLFPKHKMRFTTTFKGKDNPEGWIVLELTGADIDGVGRLYLPYEELEQLKAKGDVTTDRLKQAKMLLGGDLEEDVS